MLIGLGRDADETGRVQGLQLSLFDVSNPQRPQRLAVEPIDLGGTYAGSRAEWDHRAFSYFPEQGVVAVPVEAYGQNGAPLHRLVMFKVTPRGFEPLGEVSLDGFAARSLRIGPVLYAVSSESVKAVPLEEPTTTLGTLSLRP